MKSNKIITIGIFAIILASIFMITVNALEVKQGTSEDLTIFLQNSSSGEPLTGIVCVADVWNSSHSKLVDDGAVTEIGEGFYYYPTNTSWTGLGNYRVMVKCTISGENIFSAMMFEMVGTTIEEYLDTINTTVSNTYDYLQNTVYPAVDTLESGVADLETNNSDIWNKLVEIQSNVTTNYNEIITAQTEIGNVNTTIMTELTDHRNRLIEINTTTQTMLTNITATVNPKLDTLQSDIDLIKGFTDSLETGQGSVLGNLTIIQNYVDTLETEVGNVRSDIDNLNSTNDARFDAIDTSLTNLYTDTQSVINSGVSLDVGTNASLYSILNLVTDANTTIHDVENYLNGAVTNYLSDINTTVTDINNTVNAMYSYLQNTVYPAVDTLEAGINDLDSNTSDIWNKLVEIQGNVTTNYNEIMDAQTIMSSVNQTVMNELTYHRNRLLDINTTTWATLNNITQTINPKLDGLQTDIDLIKGYTDTLETGQGSVLGNLTTIQNYVDTLETEVGNVRTDITNLNSTNDARFDAIDTSLSDIYSDTQSLVSSGLSSAQNQTLYAILSLITDANVTIHSVEDYLTGTVTNYLSDINTTVTDINNTVNAMYSYLQNTVYPAVDTVEASLADLAQNNTDMWNKLVEIQGNVTTNYNEIINAQTQIGDVNASIMTELVDHRNRLIEINSTSWNIYNNITQTVLPKIDSIQSDTDDLQVELALVKNYVDTLEGGQGSILGNLTVIENYVDTLETAVANLDSDLVSWSANVTTRFDTIDTTLSNIYTDTQSVINSGVSLDAITNATLNDVLNKVTETNVTIHSVEDYLTGTVTTYLAEINATTHATYDYLQNTVYPAIDTLEINIGNISLNTSDLWDKLVEIQANVTTNYNEIVNAQGLVTSMNTSVMTELVDHRNRLIEINSTTWNIYNNLTLTLLPKIDAAQTDIDSIQTEVGLVKDYVDTLELGQIQILGNISAMQTTVDTINTNTDMVELSLANLDDMIDCNGSNDGVVCAYLSLINTTVATINADTDTLEAGQTNILGNLTVIENYVDTLEAGQTTLVGYVDTLEDELNCVNATGSDVCFIVNQIAGYTDTLEAGQTTIQNYVDTLETGQVNISSQLTNIEGYTDTLETAVANLDSDLASWSNNATNRFDTIDSSLSNIYVDTQEIVNSGVELNALTNATLTDILNKVTETNVTLHEVQDYLEGNLTVLIRDVNASLFTKIEFEANMTRSQILAAIQSNSTAILAAISNNGVDINSILTKWDTYDASQIITEINANEILLNNLQSWLDAFNVTEEIRHNETNTLGQQILDWLGVFNVTEADRHNLTVALINDLSNNLSTSIGLSNDLINQLNIVGKNTTLYDEIVALANQNNQIITLAQEINLTTHTIDTNLIALNTTVAMVKSDTTDLLAKWGSYNSTTIMSQLTLMDGKLDIITSTTSNDSAVLNAVAAMESILNSTRAELGFNGSGLSAYEYMVNLDAYLVEMNTTIVNKIEFEANLTRSDIMNAIQANFTALTNEINANEGKLDSILAKWGSTDATDIIANITANRNQLITIEAWLDAFNVTEEARHNESMTLGQNILNFLGIFNGTEAERHNNTVQLLNTLQSSLDFNENLSNEIISELGYLGINESLYNDVQTILAQNTNITILVQEINLTTHTTQDIVNNTMVPKLNAMHTTTTDILAKWGIYNATELWQKTGVVETKVDTMQAWLNSFNVTEQTRYSNVMSELNDSEVLLNSLRNEIGFNGTGQTVYSKLVTLDNKIVDMNTTLYVKMETEGNQTRTELISAIVNGTTNVITEINANEAKLDTLISNWGSVNLDELMSNVTAVRNQLTTLENWLEEFNTTEQNRTDDVLAYLSDIILPEIDMTEELSNNLIVQLGFNASNETLYDKILDVQTQQNYVTNATASMLTATDNLVNQSTLISQQMDILDTSLDLSITYTAALYANWGIYDAQDIINKLNLINLKVSMLDFTNVTMLLGRFDSIESLINQTRAELGFNGTGITAYESILNLQTELNLVNESIQIAIETQGNLTRDAITNATGTIVNEVNENENHLYDILDNWGNASFDEIISNVTAVRDGITAVDAWLIAFNTTEQARHDNETGMVQNVLDWLNVFGADEDERYNAVMGNLTETKTLITQTEVLANEIIAYIGYNITNQTVYDDIQELLANMVNITSGTGGLTGIDYVLLQEGTNMIALPQTPSNISIEAVMSTLGDNFHRVDWYNETSSTWQTYNPQDPFSNDLFTMETGKAYKVWVQEDDILFIN